MVKGIAFRIAVIPGLVNGSGMARSEATKLGGYFCGPMYKLLRPLLFSLLPERAHHFTFSLVEFS